MDNLVVAETFQFGDWDKDRKRKSGDVDEMRSRELGSERRERIF